MNPLVNDYGYAVEKLRVQQELENDAAKAGLELTPDRKAAIAELAEGFAAATVEAEKLNEAQDRAKDSMQDWFDFGRTAARGFIDDLMEGKSAAEALGNVFDQLASKLMDMGLEALFGGGSGGGFGLIGELLGFANGGIARNGRAVKTLAGGGVSRSAAIFGEAGPEAAVPLPDGRRIPVDLRMAKMPSLPAAGGGGQQKIDITVGVSTDSNGNLMPFVQNVVRQGIGQYDRTLAPKTAVRSVQEHQARNG